MLSKHNDLSFAKQGDLHLTAGLSMPTDRFQAFSMRFNIGRENFRYFQSTGHSDDDVMDQSRFPFLGVKLELARNNLNYLMYPTRGLRQSISAIYVSGLEYYTPGTFAPTADRVEENRYWFGARFTRRAVLPHCEVVFTRLPGRRGDYDPSVVLERICDEHLFARLPADAAQPAGLPEGFPQQVVYRRRNHPDVRIRTEVLFEKQRLCVFAGRCEQKYGRRGASGYATFSIHRWCTRRISARSA